MNNTSKRLQLYFPYPLYLELKNEMEKKGKSMASIVRDAVEKFLGSEESSWEKDPINKIIGMCNTDITDISYNHDKYLYGKGKKK